MSKPEAMQANTSGVCSDQGLHALLNRYQDNELDAALRGQVHAHIQSCALCREELAQMDRVVLAVKELEEIETGPSFNAVLMDRIQKTQESRSRGWIRLFSQLLSPRLPSLPSVAYSLVFLVFLVLGLLMNGFFGAPGTVSEDSHTVRADIDLGFTQLLDESQQLSLLHVQDQTFGVLGDLDHRNVNHR